MSDLVMLYSGGADSRLMLEFARMMGKKPYCILINYGQVHIEELEFARKQLTAFQVPHHTVNVSNLNVHSGLTGDGTKDISGEVHEMHVPGRNTIFLGIAFSVAESKEIDTIWLGSDFSDRLNLFPDCYQEYIVKVNELFQVAGPKPISVEAPLAGLTKESVLAMLRGFHIGEDTLFSGYGDA